MNNGGIDTDGPFFSSSLRGAPGCAVPLAFAFTAYATGGRP